MIFGFGLLVDSIAAPRIEPATSKVERRFTETYGVAPQGAKDACFVSYGVNGVFDDTFFTYILNGQRPIHRFSRSAVPARVFRMSLHSTVPPLLL